MDDFQAAIQELQDSQWLQSLHHFDTVDSTNSAARRYAREPSCKLPSLFVADTQTAGRGRGGHVWWSPSGCLMLTLAISGDQMPDSRRVWSQLALLTGVSAAEAVEQLHTDLVVQLKWPNDLYLQNKKMGGILIESFNATMDNDQVNRSCFAIGIGINVDMQWELAPPEVAARATCISSAIGLRFSRGQLLVAIVQQLQQRITQWQQELDSWHAAWHPRCLLSGKIVCVDRSFTPGTKQRLHGRCEGVDAEGNLLVRCEDGQVTSVSVGEVISWHS